ncbi:MAG TPA: o-succinylbenzoate synthase, partial [Thermomicrobiaceae bacterium]|nr:o-succinylbenzoate synthase [Thermomicrobiaceae bacterium]
MRIRALSWRRYRIPLVAPFATAHGVLTERHGLLLQLETDEGVTGLGEAAPLPGFGGDVKAAEAALRVLAPLVQGLPLGQLPAVLGGLPGGVPGMAAARCALDIAALDAEGQAVSKPVAALLAREWVETVPVNATVGAALPVDAVKECRAAVAAGFRCVKLKVGVTDSRAFEFARIEAVRAALPP